MVLDQSMEPATSWLPVAHAADWATEPGPIFLIFLENTDRGSSNQYLQFMFAAKIRKA